MNDLERSAWFQLDVGDGESCVPVRPGEDLRRTRRPAASACSTDASPSSARSKAGPARSRTSWRKHGLARPTAHRLIQGLEDHGFLASVGGFGYALGPRLLALAASAMRDLPLRELARPALERLARSTGESAQLYVRDGDRRICIDAAESRSELRTIVEIGASLPLTKGSAGKIFLAWSADHDRTRLVRSAEDPERLERKLGPRGAEDGRTASPSARPASPRSARRSRARRRVARGRVRLRTGHTRRPAPREALRTRGVRPPARSSAPSAPSYQA